MTLLARSPNTSPSQTTMCTGGMNRETILTAAYKAFGRCPDLGTSNLIKTLGPVTGISKCGPRIARGCHVMAHTYHIHTEIISVQQFGSRKLCHHLFAKYSAPRKTRTCLSQLRSGWSYFQNAYLHRLRPQQRRTLSTV